MVVFELSVSIKLTAPELSPAPGTSPSKQVTHLEMAFAKAYPQRIVKDGKMTFVCPECKAVKKTCVSAMDSHIC